MLFFSYLPPSEQNSDLVSAELTLQVTTQENQQDHKTWNFFQGAATFYCCSSTIASVSRKPVIHHCYQPDGALYNISLSLLKLQNIFATHLIGMCGSTKS